MITFPRLFLAGIIGCVWVASASADSPLTSTTFHKSYHESAAVKKAAQTHFLSDDLLAVLQDDSTPIQEKFALVNALGWSFNQNLDNSKIYLRELASDKGILEDRFREHLDKFSSEELTLLGYMMALENYLEDPILVTVVPLLEEAVFKHRESYCANLALTLVNAQILMADVEKWNRVWNAYETLKVNTHTKRKLKPEAIQVIEEYLKLYQNG